MLVCFFLSQTNKGDDTVKKAPDWELFLSEELRLKSEEKWFFDYNLACVSGLLINQTSYFLFCKVCKC